MTDYSAAVSMDAFITMALPARDVSASQFIVAAFLAATKQLYEWFSPSLCLFVRPSITPFSLCSHHRIIMKVSGVITNDKSDVHPKGQSQGHQGHLAVSGL